MRYLPAFLFLSLLCGAGCKPPDQSAKIEQWKAEVLAAEHAFDSMAQEKGLVEAFVYFAAEDGVLRRRKDIIQGKTDIREWYQNDVRPNETLSWKPTFVDVSQSGDLAYTYGDYVFSYPDTLGNIKQNTGIFHTVWKRQANGEWKYVWD